MKLTKAQTKMMNKAKDGILQIFPQYRSAPAHAADMRVVKALMNKGLVTYTEDHSYRIVTLTAVV